MASLKVFNTVLMKYKILIIRNKISFMAFEKRMTVNELFLNTILKCFQELNAEKLVKKNNSIKILKKILKNSGKGSVV
jgi:hypothetical protein